MIIATTKKWGNSFGLRIKKEDFIGLDLKENEDVVIEIQKKVNPLKQLFGFDNDKRISKNKFDKNRKALESRWV